MNKIPCLKHAGLNLQYIKQDSNKTELVCNQCLVELDKEKVKIEFKNLIYMDEALKSPEYFLSKVISWDRLSLFFNLIDKYNDNTINTILNEFQTKVSNLYSALQAAYKELEQCAKDFLEKKSKIRDEITNIMKFDQFQQIFINFEQQGNSINPESYEQNEKILHEYFQDLTKNDFQDLNKNLSDMLDHITRVPKDLNEEQFSQYKKFEEEVTQFTHKQQFFTKQINFGNILQLGALYDGKLMLLYQQLKVVNIIQSKLNKKIINFQEIYLGSRDGLNGQCFWNKVNGKGNLLMIFKSKSGYIFGGFSPCQWYQTNKTCQDNTMSSFLFSQTHDQIYLLKEANKAQAIQCQQSTGPAFGSGDLSIGADFQYGSSKLGESYQCDQYQIVTKNTHLFGQTSPYIVECEIYQVMLS